MSKPTSYMDCHIAAYNADQHEHTVQTCTEFIEKLEVKALVDHMINYEINTGAFLHGVSGQKVDWQYFANVELGITAKDKRIESKLRNVKKKRFSHIKRESDNKKSNEPYTQYDQYIFDYAELEGPYAYRRNLSPSKSSKHAIASLEPPKKAAKHFADETPSVNIFEDLPATAVGCADRIRSYNRQIDQKMTEINEKMEEIKELRKWIDRLTLHIIKDKSGQSTSRGF